MLTPKTVDGALKAFTKITANLRAVAEAQGLIIEKNSVKVDVLMSQIDDAMFEVSRANALAVKLDKLLEV